MEAERKRIDIYLEGSRNIGTWCNGNSGPFAEARIRIKKVLDFGYILSICHPAHKQQGTEQQQQGIT
jgi:hypothetical protein